MDGRTNNKGTKGNKGGGRKGFALELKKKRLIEKSIDITEKNLTEDKAFQITLKEIGKQNNNFDVGGDLIITATEEEREAIKYYDKHSKTEGSHTE